MKNNFTSVDFITYINNKIEFLMMLNTWLQSRFDKFESLLDFRGKSCVVIVEYNRRCHVELDDVLKQLITKRLLSGIEIDLGDIILIHQNSESIICEENKLNLYLENRIF